MMKSSDLFISQLKKQDMLPYEYEDCTVNL